MGRCTYRRACSRPPEDSRTGGCTLSGLDRESRGGDIGLNLFKTNFDSVDDSMVAYITKDYATGWMVGDIRGCLLADSNVGTIVGSALITGDDSTFDTTTGSWVANGGGIISSDAGRLKILNCLA